MAGDWIKMRIDLQTHPKVFRMVSALQADRLRVIGGLHVAWSIFDTHSADGVLHGYTREAMDAVVGWPGFTQAMIDVDWVSVQDDGSLVMPRFDEHNGASAKRRANDNERKRASRKGKPVRKVSASDADELRTREEKRREDKNPLSAREPVDPRMPSEMTLDWHPDHKLLKTYSVHSGVALDLFTEEARRAFTAHYEPRGQVNTQAEWVQMLVKWVLNDRNRAAASNVKPFPPRQNSEPDFDSSDWANNLVVSP
ncbi:DnaT-like ssDNA-binding domain-containing protein [Pseudomonas capsici]|uniref:DnaT-like ssDNA-binding domain-containing protein n=1 Tax=Pseudomonas capsici TaxID=2810614 RepID=UPI0021F0CF57|nr:DnaT-like ssDNA-binding domain-containing protein [Pseudomonas capsici]MCV4287901.1 DnaT-like ssDNA-binding domain-containing protein [Pseudomonas capsici]